MKYSFAAKFPSGLLWVACFIPCSFLFAQPTTSYNDVLVMINDSSVNSVTIGNYFVQRRNIPLNHVFHFRHDTTKFTDRGAASWDFGETVDSATFMHEIFWPLENFMRTRNLVDSINYIVSTKGSPLRVSVAATDTIGYYFAATSSMTDCIALANGKDSVYMLKNKRYAPAYSRYFTGDGQPAHFQHNQNSMPYYLTTRLDAYTPEEVIALIQRSENPAYVGQGIIVIDQAPASYAEGNQWMALANDSMVARDLDVIFDTTTLYLTKQKNVLAYVSWGSNDGNYGATSTHAIPENTWLNGAIAETYVSTGGRSFNPGTAYGQSLIADLVSEGVTGVKGYTDEPYLSVMAQPELLFPRYVDGFNLAESYWSSSPDIAWRQVVIGDPKMTLKRAAIPSATALSFGTLARYTDTTATLTVRNNFTGPIQVQQVKIIGADSLRFTVTPPVSLPSSIAARDSMTFIVRFNATAYTSQSATATIPIHFATNGKVKLNIALAGTGARPSIRSIDTVQYGIVSTADSMLRLISVVNQSKTDTIYVSTMTIAGSTDFQLRLNGPPPASLELPATIYPGDSILVPVTFVPSDTVVRTATLKIRSTATVSVTTTNAVLRGHGGVPSAVTTVTPDGPGLALSRAYPQPFADETMITFATDSPRDATIRVYDLMGRVVANLTEGIQGQNSGVVRFDAAGLPDGAYVCKLSNGASTVTRTLLHLR